MANNAVRDTCTSPISVMMGIFLRSEIFLKYHRKSVNCALAIVTSNSIVRNSFEMTYT